MNQSAPVKKKKKRVTRVIAPTSITIMNTSVYSFWTDRGRVDPKGIKECDREIGLSLIEGGVAKEYKTGEA